jgi:hypothetical protein
MGEAREAALRATIDQQTITIDRIVVGGGMLRR